MKSHCKAIPYAVINAIITIFSCFSLALYATHVGTLSELMAFSISFIIGTLGFFFMILVVRHIASSYAP